MARRGAAPNSGPAYYSGRDSLPPANESGFSAFLREQVFAPDKLPGNINILTGAALFFGGIFAMRTWGELMIPA